MMVGNLNEAVQGPVKLELSKKNPSKKKNLAFSLAQAKQSNSRNLQREKKPNVEQFSPDC